MLLFWVIRSGAHWHDLPERYGKYKTLHKRFTRLAKAGAWERIFADLTNDPDNQYPMLDRTVVRAHQQAANKKGRPLRFILIGDEAHDVTTAADLLDGQTADGISADKAYDANAPREMIEEADKEAVIPSKRSRKIQIPHDAQADKLRNRIERFFNKLKHVRRIATRYDRRAAYFPAAAQRASCVI
jgi:transposase